MQFVTEHSTVAPTNVSVLVTEKKYMRNDIYLIYTENYSLKYSCLCL